MMLKFTHNSKIDKIIRFSRFLLVKLILKKCSTQRVGLIGANNKLVFKNDVVIGNKFITADDVEIIALGNINIGNNVCINSYSRVVSHKKIIIGDNVTVAKFVTILDHDHKYSFECENLKLDGFVTDDIIIGNNVWIGDKVTILKGVNIGNNVIVGANSVVNKSIPPNSIVAGTPAKIIKKL